MTNKLPAFQFYPSDWRSDNGVQALSYFERGVWFEILCLMHESEQRGKLLLNGRPMPEDALARLLGLDKQILTKTLTTILDYGVATVDEDGVLINRRMINDENLRKIRTESGKKGGNPNLVNQNSTKEENQVNQKSTPSSSSSSSLKRTTNVVPKKQGCRIPDDFTLDTDMRSWAAKETPGAAVEFEFQNFVDYYKSATGKNATGLDWKAKWRTWMRNAYTKFGTVTPAAAVKPTTEEETFAAEYEAAERKWRSEIPRPNGVNANA